jgi:hypothetical protein
VRRWAAVPPASRPRRRERPASRERYRNPTIEIATELGSTIWMKRDENRFGPARIGSLNAFWAASWNAERCPKSKFDRGAVARVSLAGECRGEDDAAFPLQQAARRSVTRACRGSAPGTPSDHEEGAKPVGFAPVVQTSTRSAMARASSTSMPRYLMVLSILVWPNSSCTARKLPIRR